MEDARALRILFVEDLPTDAELAVRELKASGLAFDHLRVESRETFLSALQAFKPDIIISDYAMPLFDGMQALRLSLEQDPMRPFIILTGSMNEDTAVACMKAGATDYLIKGHISRLPFAVREAMEYKRVRKERENAAQALDESRRKYKELFENSVAGMFRARMDGVVLEVNQALCDLFGSTRSELLSLPDAMHWADPSARQEFIARLRQDGVVNNAEADFIVRNGEVRHCLLSARLYAGEGFIEGTLIDISERKRAEEALSESERRFRALAENSVDTIMRFDRDCRHLYVNPGVRNQAGIAPEEFIGRTHRELGFHEDLCALWEEGIARVFATGGVHRQEFLLPNGVWIDWLLAPETDEAGNVAAVIGSARDITQLKLAMEEKRRLEAQLLQSQKIEAIGQLAGGVAHDFNNLLTPILGYTEMILSELHADDPRRRNFLLVQKAALSASDLTRQLLAFSRKQVLEMKPVDLNRIFSGFRKILRRTIREDIDIRLQATDGPLSIKADVAQIEQIIMNLAVNAQDAMPDGGVLNLKTAEVEWDKAFLAANPEARPGRYALLEVSDTGQGMDSGLMEHIFEPFFTTKEIGKGTGLGLSTVYGIVKQHAGFIYVSSLPGKGTTFSIYLPWCAETAAGPADEGLGPQDAPDGFSEGVTVVVVEDDALVGDLTCDILKEHGYSVIYAKNGRECLELLKDYQGRIDLMLTDVIMPGMNGRDLYDMVARTRPGLPVIYMSGYSEDVIAHHGFLEKGLDLINKPFTRKVLLGKIRAALGRQTS